MKNSILYKSLLILSFVALGLLIRFIPSIPNFSSFIAIALFSGIIFPKSKYAYIFPFAVQAALDIILGVNSSNSLHVFAHILTIYLGLGLVVFTGQLASKRINFLKSLVSVTIGNTLFFLITNLGSWIQLPIYDASLSGLIQSYIAALPFFKNSLISGLIFSTILFFTYRLYDQKVLKPIPITEK